MLNPPRVCFGNSSWHGEQKPRSKDRHLIKRTNTRWQPICPHLRPTSPQQMQNDCMRAPERLQQRTAKIHSGHHRPAQEARNLHATAARSPTKQGGRKAISGLTLASARRWLLRTWSGKSPTKDVGPGKHIQRTACDESPYEEMMS